MQVRTIDTVGVFRALSGRENRRRRLAQLAPLLGLALAIAAVVAARSSERMPRAQDARHEPPIAESRFLDVLDVEAAPPARATTTVRRAPTRRWSPPGSAGDIR